MTNYNETFQLLDKAITLDDAKVGFITFLRSEADNLRTHPQDTLKIAYGIAGMLATRSARILETNCEPIGEILAIAGELEIDSPEVIVLRDELLLKIDSL